MKASIEGLIRSLTAVSESPPGGNRQHLEMVQMVPELDT